MEKTIVTSAPAKVILLGGHAVNRGFAALCTAVALRTICCARVRADDGYTLRFGERSETGDRARLRGFKAEIDALRQVQALNQITALVREDFFAPTRYVLAHVMERIDGLGLDIEWSSEIPVASGLGSGAAASTSMALAALRIAGLAPEPQEIAWLAWQGDVIAHGGIGSALDSSTCALGGVVRFTIKDGAITVPLATNLPLVIGDTGTRATTAEVNTRVRTFIEQHPMRFHLFAEIGMLVEQAQEALVKGDLVTLGHLLNLNQLCLEKLDVSTPKIEALIEAALGAGALGAKISGKGMGGIIIALCEPGKQAEVAAAIEA
ncbi:MAG: mevalonate kinase, partial [Anaerolineae bacterium]|nr:mevalonate kinase [Anaerolineae bacterium]